MYRFGWFPIHHLLNFTRIYGNTIVGNGVPQEFDAFQPEFTFGEFSIKLMISQTLKDNSEMVGVFFLVFRIDEDIIDKDHDKLIELRHEYGVHEVHEVGRCVSESEGHDQEFVKTITSGKSGFWNIAWSNLDLVVARTKVNFREDFGTSQLIKQNINSRKWVFVFDSDCIERSIIYAHPQATIFLFDKESRATPRRRARANVALI
jgi:hypothetical protein